MCAAYICGSMPSAAKFFQMGATDCQVSPPSRDPMTVPKAPTASAPPREFSATENSRLFVPDFVTVHCASVERFTSIAPCWPTAIAAESLTSTPRSASAVGEFSRCQLAPASLLTMMDPPEPTATPRCGPNATANCASCAAPDSTICTDGVATPVP